MAWEFVGSAPREYRAAPSSTQIKKLSVGVVVQLSALSRKGVSATTFLRVLRTIRS